LASSHHHHQQQQKVLLSMHPVALPTNRRTNFKESAART
jgi:hypothetical protein